MINKLSISERTKIKEELRDDAQFYTDLELFRKTFPFSPLNNQLARVNSINKNRLHGQMLYELLSKLSKEEIIQVRNEVIAKQDAEAKAIAEAELKAKQEAEAKVLAEAELLAKQEAELKAKQEAEAKARAEAEQKAKEEAEAKALAEAELFAKQEAELKAKQEEEAKVRAEAEQKAKEEAEAKFAEAGLKAKEEAEAKARAEAEQANTGVVGLETPESERTTTGAKEVATPEEVQPDSSEETTVQKNKRKKHEEFPKINWNNNTDPDIQTCILLYDDRVNTFYRMQEIHFLIDDNPTLAKEMAELDIRNQLAHKELQSYNDNACFLHIHSLTIQKKFTDDTFLQLSTLKAENPDKFLDEITNNTQNIRRINSNLNNKKYKSEEEKRSWEENLRRAKIRQNILKQLLKS